jgi:hypothetical protein
MPVFGASTKQLLDAMHGAMPVFKQSLHGNHPMFAASPAYAATQAGARS